MEALLSACRVSGRSTIGSYMYVTTQPCDNCIKHILCAGISKVYFIEPYPKSLASKLHGESIALDPVDDKKEVGKLLVLPYNGVAPKRFHDFFSKNHRRKDGDGYALRFLKKHLASEPKFSQKIMKRCRSVIFENNYDLSLLDQHVLFAELENGIEISEFINERRIKNGRKREKREA